MKPVWRERLQKYFGEKNLQIGSGHRLQTDPTWTNLDLNPKSGAQVIHDLHSLPLPFPDETFDCVLGSHVLEHIRQELLIPLVYDIARILKPGGRLIAFVPYGTNDAAWENPHHRQCFTEATWSYFDKRLYEQWDTAGFDAGQLYQYAQWAIEELSLTPMKEWIDKPAEEIDKAKFIYRNIIEEMQVVLKKESM